MSLFIISSFFFASANHPCSKELNFIYDKQGFLIISLIQLLFSKCLHPKKKKKKIRYIPQHCQLLQVFFFLSIVLSCNLLTVFSPTRRLLWAFSWTGPEKLPLFSVSLLFSLPGADEHLWSFCLGFPGSASQYFKVKSGNHMSQLVLIWIEDWGSAFLSPSMKEFDLARDIWMPLLCLYCWFLRDCGAVALELVKCRNRKEDRGGGLYLEHLNSQITTMCLSSL